MIDAALAKDSKGPLAKNAMAGKNVLIYRLGSLGDTIVALPALHLVARKYPSARRIMLTNVPIHAKAPAAEAVLGGSSLVDDYLQYPIGTRNLKELLKLWWSIRRIRPEALIYLAKPRGERALARDSRFFRLCGIKNIIGLPTGDLSVNLPLGGDLRESEAGRLVRSLRPLGEIDLNVDASWDLELTSAEIDEARNKLQAIESRPFLVCGPGTKMQAKDWGVAKWCELMERLSLLFPGHALVLVGSKEEYELSQKIRESWSGVSANFCGELSPRETAAVLKNAALYLGPDSGPMHLAAGVGVPCVIAFAARTKPGIWFPQGHQNHVLYRQVDCAGCDLETCVVQQKKCLSAITVEQMVAAAVEALKLRHKA